LRSVADRRRAHDPWPTRCPLHSHSADTHPHNPTRLINRILHHKNKPLDRQAPLAPSAQPLWAGVQQEARAHSSDAHAYGRATARAGLSQHHPRPLLYGALLPMHANGQRPSHTMRLRAAQTLSHTLAQPTRYMPTGCTPPAASASIGCSNQRFPRALDKTWRLNMVLCAITQQPTQQSADMLQQVLCQHASGLPNQPRLNRSNRYYIHHRSHCYQVVRCCGTHSVLHIRTTDGKHTANTTSDVARVNGAEARRDMRQSF
jgi:hypothetical protein